MPHAEGKKYKQTKTLNCTSVRQFNVFAYCQFNGIHLTDNCDILGGYAGWEIRRVGGNLTAHISRQPEVHWTHNDTVALRLWKLKQGKLSLTQVTLNARLTS